MKLLITGVCGFVGSSLARWFSRELPDVTIRGIDNFVRPGSETHRRELPALGIDVRHGDVRAASDFEVLPPVDWVIDAAANPSVLAGVDGRGSTRQVIEHNLQGTINVLEFCKNVRAGLILLSTSRVYSIRDLAGLPLAVRDGAFGLDSQRPLPRGVSIDGIAAEFPTSAPISLYGATKLASETLALEYAAAFDLPLWINRCGVLAGPGQFGTAEQGIFSYWIHAYAQKRPLRYLGFDGQGHQVRDALHPDDLAALVLRQMRHSGRVDRWVFNVGGGPANALSLRQLTAWCSDRFGAHTVASDPTPRTYDVPWVVMDNSTAANELDWKPQRTLLSVLDEIATHAEHHPRWLDMTGGV